MNVRGTNVKYDLTYSLLFFDGTQALCMKSVSSIEFWKNYLLWVLLRRLYRVRHGNAFVHTQLQCQK